MRGMTSLHSCTRSRRGRNNSPTTALRHTSMRPLTWRCAMWLLLALPVRQPRLDAIRGLNTSSDWCRSIRSCWATLTIAARTFISARSRSPSTSLRLSHEVTRGLILTNLRLLTAVIAVQEVIKRPSATQAQWLLKINDDKSPQTLLLEYWVSPCHCSRGVTS